MPADDRLTPRPRRVALTLTVAAAVLMVGGAGAAFRDPTLSGIACVLQPIDVRRGALKTALEKTRRELKPRCRAAAARVGDSDALSARHHRN
jgi:hypothetical protein